jgi:hypothetical protein
VLGIIGYDAVDGRKRRPLLSLLSHARSMRRSRVRCFTASGARALAPGGMIIASAA